MLIYTNKAVFYCVLRYKNIDFLFDKDKKAWFNQ